MTHCVTSVQIRSFFWSVLSRIRTEYGEILRTVFSPNAEKYGPEKTPYLDTFHAVNELVQMFNIQIQTLKKHIFFKREQNKFYNHPKEHS